MKAATGWSLPPCLCPAAFVVSARRERRGFLAGAKAFGFWSARIAPEAGVPIGIINADALLCDPVVADPSNAHAHTARWGNVERNIEQLIIPASTCRARGTCPGGCETWIGSARCVRDLPDMAWLSPCPLLARPSSPWPQAPVFTGADQVAPHMPVSTFVCLAPLARLGKHHACRFEAFARQGGAGRCLTRNPPIACRARPAVSLDT